MNKDTRNYLWFTRDLEHLFLIPDRVVFMPGMNAINNLKDELKLVSLDALASYKCSRNEAKQHLCAAWQESLESTKQAWLDLYAFSQLIGQSIDLGELGKQFQEGLQMAGPQAQEIFSASQGFVESVVGAAQTQETLSEAEHKEVFKHVFSQLPQLIDQFSEDNLEAAAQDPDAWADKLYRRVFDEADKEKFAKRKEELANDIRNSIAKGLRSAGMKPSTDWKRRKCDKR